MLPPPPQSDSKGMFALHFIIGHFYDIVQLLFVPKCAHSNIQNVFLLAFLLFACPSGQFPCWDEMFKVIHVNNTFANPLTSPRVLAASHPSASSPAGAWGRKVPGARARIDFFQLMLGWLFTYLTCSEGLTLNYSFILRLLLKLVSLLLRRHQVFTVHCLLTFTLA